MLITEALEARPKLLEITRRGWSVRALVDRANRRLDVKAYRVDRSPSDHSENGTAHAVPDEVPPGGRIADLCVTLLANGHEHGLGKIIIRVREEDWRSFLACGFILEGLIDGYFQGEGDGYYLVYFLDPRRQVSHHLEEEQAILAQAALTKPVPAPDVEQGYELLPGTPELADEVADLFGRVFVSYPTPLSDAKYLRKQMEARRSFYRLVRYGGRLVSAMSAEVDWTTRSAEMTDCATLPEYRGRGLIQIQLGALAQEMERQEIPTLYSIARARSRGMNIACRRAGYVFRGRLVQNCEIMGRMEDMNLWVAAE